MNFRDVRPDLREVPVALLDEPRLISRITVQDANVEYLAGQMRQFGFTSAILVARAGDRYEVIAGHHRMLAARLAGIPAVPALVYPSYDDGIEALQHGENADRFPTTAADEAVWFAQLLEKYADAGTDGLAARVGKTRAYVEGRLALLAGDEQVFAALSADTISIGVAQQLNRCTDERHRRYLLDLALRMGATVATVGAWIHEWKTVHEPATAATMGAAAVTTGAAVLTDEYFRCRVCGERDNTSHMTPVNVHDYCLRALIDPATGFFRSKADYVEFPRTRETALALVQRVLDRFPELADQSAAHS